MQFSLKYLLALSLSVTAVSTNAELMQASALNGDAESSNLAARILSKDAIESNSSLFKKGVHTQLNSLQITETSGERVRTEAVAAKIDVPEEPSIIDRLNEVASSTVKKFSQTGLASWYGRQFHGRKTASGDTFDMHGLTAAHRSLPLNCYIRVTNKSNGKSVVVKVNDRGPFHGNRVVDLSYAAAKSIGLTNKGVGNVSIERVSGPNS